MGQKKKNNTEEIKSLNKTVDNLHEKNETRKDNNTGAVNQGNLINSGRSKSKTELHTKSVVLGSDSDGQAD
ncbi:MAG: hypothetical protein ABIR18_08965 [Chitinophagaceae bacterium]